MKTEEREGAVTLEGEPVSLSLFRGRTCLVSVVPSLDTSIVPEISEHPDYNAALEAVRQTAEATA